MSVVNGYKVNGVKYDFPSIPAGGTTGQVLAKASNTSIDVAWTSLSGIAEWSTKQDTLTAGDGIGITNNVISVVNGVYFEEET